MAATTSGQQLQQKQVESSGVQVSCRLRGQLPLGSLESTTATTSALNAVIQFDPANATRICFAPPYATQNFHFDHVFPPDASQQTLFERIGQPCVRDLLLGYNCTILAYGQTGSGKTYTTIGSSGQQNSNSSEDGLVPRILEQLFHDTPLTEDSNNNSGSHVAFTVSFVEVYQERLRDLLRRQQPPCSTRHPSSSSSLRIREETTSSAGNGSANVWVEGATEVPLSDLKTARAVLARGLAQRAVGATQLNGDSSRSHAVFAISMTKRTLSGQVIKGRLCVVDLAGSEQAKKSQATCMRLEEAKHINRSLSALGNVIHALTTTTAMNGKRPVHVPYRDSKLTRLLQSSLGGNAKTHLLLTCATALRHVDESLSTLRFGARAKQMQNRPTVNTNVNGGDATAAAARASESAELLATLEQKIASLCQYIRELESAATAYGNAATTCPRCQATLLPRPSSVDSANERDVEEPEGVTTADDDADDTEENDRTAATSPSTCGAASDSDELSSDVIMQAELVALRRTLAEMNRLHEYEKTHAISLAHSVGHVEDHELVRLHRCQATEIQRLELQLYDAHAKMSTLQRRWTEQQQQFETELAQTVRVLEAQHHHQESGRDAESEILRRRLERADQQTKTLQLELVASQQDLHELHSLIDQANHANDTLRDENDALSRKIQEMERRKMDDDAVSSSRLLLLPVPSQSKPLLLRPVTVAAGSSKAIQSWWTGTSEPADGEDVSTAADGETVGLQNAEGRHNQAVVAAAAESAEPLVASKPAKQRRSRPTGPSPGTTTITPPPDLYGTMRDQRQQQGPLHTSGGGVRGRLVGLLNSLEEETTAYKELLVGSSGDASSATSTTSSPSARPVAPRRRTMTGSMITSSSSSSSSACSSASALSTGINAATTATAGSSRKQRLPGLEINWTSDDGHDGGAMNSPVAVVDDGSMQSNTRQHQKKNVII